MKVCSPKPLSSYSGQNRQFKSAVQRYLAPQPALTYP